MQVAVTQSPKQLVGVWHNLPATDKCATVDYHVSPVVYHLTRHPDNSFKILFRRQSHFLNAEADRIQSYHFNVQLILLEEIEGLSIGSLSIGYEAESLAKLACEENSRH